MLFVRVNDFLRRLNAIYLRQVQVDQEVPVVLARQLLKLLLNHVHGNLAAAAEVRLKVYNLELSLEQ